MDVGVYKWFLSHLASVRQSFSHWDSEVMVMSVMTATKQHLRGKVAGRDVRVTVLNRTDKPAPSPIIESLNSFL